jgi:hypothetical protein
LPCLHTSSCWHHQPALSPALSTNCPLFARMPCGGTEGQKRLLSAELCLWMHGYVDWLNLPMLQPMQPIITHSILRPQPITTTPSLLHPHAGFSPAAGDKGKAEAISNLNSAAGPSAVVEGHAHHSGTERRESPNAAERGKRARSSEEVEQDEGGPASADADRDDNAESMAITSDAGAGHSTEAEAGPQPSASHDDEWPRGTWGPAHIHQIAGLGLTTARIHPPVKRAPRANPDVYIGFDELFHKRCVVLPSSRLVQSIYSAWPHRSSSPVAAADRINGEATWPSDHRIK